MRRTTCHAAHPLTRTSHNIPSPSFRLFVATPWTLPPYGLDRTEVTHEAYDAGGAMKVCRAKSESVGSNYPRSQGPKHPINGVSWDDAKKYCESKGKRLPREAEYERAVRGDDGRR